MRSLTRARAVLASNYGRADGWFVELDGVRVGELTDARFEDMFWYSYSVSAVSPETESILLDDSNWGRCRFSFRNRRTGDLVASAFCGGTPPFVREGRVFLRALYLMSKTPSERLWLSVLSWFRTR